MKNDWRKSREPVRDLVDLINDSSKTDRNEVRGMHPQVSKVARASCPAHYQSLFGVKEAMSILFISPD